MFYSKANETPLKQYPKPEDKTGFICISKMIEIPKDVDLVRLPWKHSVTGATGKASSSMWRTSLYFNWVPKKQSLAQMAFHRMFVSFHLMAVETIIFFPFYELASSFWKQEFLDESSPLLYSVLLDYNLEIEDLCFRLYIRKTLGASCDFEVLYHQTMPCMKKGLVDLVFDAKRSAREGNRNSAILLLNHYEVSFLEVGRLENRAKHSAFIIPCR